MPSSPRSWNVSCRACDLVIGTVEDGRFVHAAACTKPLSIGGGVMRCCRCGGPLTGDPQPRAAVAEPTDWLDGDEWMGDVEPWPGEAPTAIILPFVPGALRDGDSRQRL